MIFFSYNTYLLKSHVPILENFNLGSFVHGIRKGIFEDKNLTMRFLFFMRYSDKSMPFFQGEGTSGMEANGSYPCNHPSMTCQVRHVKGTV